jgi:predicted transposase YdaD
LALKKKSIMSVEQTGYESRTFREVFGEGREEGREQGRQEGRALGQKQALRRMLRRTLEQRFGAIDHDTHEKIAACESIETLEHWFDRALSAESAAEVF